MATVFVKLSVLALIYEIFSANRGMRIACIAMFSLVCVWGLALLLTTSLLCRPIAKNWNPELPGSCGSQAEEVIAFAGANMVIDFLITLMPLPVLWTLQMSFKKKVWISVVLSLGLGYVPQPQTL